MRASSSLPPRHPRVGGFAAFTFLSHECIRGAGQNLQAAQPFRCFLRQ